MASLLVAFSVIQSKVQGVPFLVYFSYPAWCFLNREVQSEVAPMYNRSIEGE